ncbi:MAG TPA: sulfatase [Bryobacteraceae bacterium]|nr:sulfatase [Bryobacteraceae bacterium]
MVFILADDQRWDCLSCAGHPILKTPHLDRIANEGVRFSNAFSTTSLCSPARASYLSGLYAHTHGVINNFTDYPKDLPSYPRQLQAAGYETAYIGKFHMGEQFDDPRPGFDYWASHKGQGTYYDTEFNINGKRQMMNGYYTHRVTELAVDWLKKPRQKPFVLAMGHKAPHMLCIPEPKYEHAFDQLPANRPATADDTGNGKPVWVKERVKTWHGIEGPLYGSKDYADFLRRYLGTIQSVDDSVGQIYETLRATGELDNTVLMFAADHGFLLGEHGCVDKRAMYEESIRVPFLVRYPGLIQTPAVLKQMVLNVDFAPSVLDVCGAAPLPKTHGKSWKPLLQNPQAPGRKSWYYEYNYEQQFPYTPNVRGVRTEEWKYVHSPNGDDAPDKYVAELYNVKDDPLETKTLIHAPEMKPKVEELKAELARLQQETDVLPDHMPVNPEMKMVLPDQKIR